MNTSSFCLLVAGSHYDKSHLVFELGKKICVVRVLSDCNLTLLLSAFEILSFVFVFAFLLLFFFS